MFFAGELKKIFELLNSELSHIRLFAVPVLL
jgi:hypothetical protein